MCRSTTNQPTLIVKCTSCSLTLLMSPFWSYLSCYCCVVVKQDASGPQDRSSDGTNSFNCPICEKLFCNRYYLKKHILVHTNEMPYKCDDCGKLFRWHASLKNHKTLEHKGENPMACKECGRCFKSVHSLKKHCLIDHGSAKIFMCGSCPKYFMSSYAQARHEMIHRKWQTDWQTDYILPGGRVPQLLFAWHYPARTASVDRSACSLVPSVSMQFMGVSYTDNVQTNEQTKCRPYTNSNWWTVYLFTWCLPCWFNYRER